MPELPLHPAIVHFPLGLAVVMPFLALAVGIAMVRNRVPRAAWVTIILLQLLMVGATFVASSTGEREAEIVSRHVDHKFIHEHEEAATWFLWCAVATAVAAFGALRQMSRKRGARFAVAATVALSLLSAAAAARTGILGGELVYVHGAAAARASGK